MTHGADLALPYWYKAYLSIPVCRELMRIARDFKNKTYAVGLLNVDDLEKRSHDGA
jgi:hypothetical protein